MDNFIKTFPKLVTVHDSTVIKQQWYTVNVSEVFFGTDNHEAMNKINFKGLLQYLTQPCSLLA